jgi:hypothetical protein
MIFGEDSTLLCFMLILVIASKWSTSRKKMKIDMVKTRPVVKTYAFEKEDVNSTQQTVLEVSFKISFNIVSDVKSMLGSIFTLLPWCADFA